MKISLVVPVYNEADAIPLFCREVQNKLSNYQIEILFVNDGSTDSTEQVIDAISAQNPDVKGLNFTRNFGKEAALFAGIEHANGDAVIPIDVDLQDPVEVIPLLIAKWGEGWPVVLARRSDRRSDGYFKQKTASWFYRIHNKISRQRLEDNVGDFRLLSCDTVEAIRMLQERNLFMKGIMSWAAGRVAIIDYVRAPRVAGTTKFNGWKLWNLALEGLTSFSTLPLRVWTYLSVMVARLSFFYGTWMIIEKLVWGNPVPGYPSVIVSILFLGGIQLIGIGVLGEYIGRIYTEVKRRPRYILRK